MTKRYRWPPEEQQQAARDKREEINLKGEEKREAEREKREKRERKEARKEWEWSRLDRKKCRSRGGLRGKN